MYYLNDHIRFLYCDGERKTRTKRHPRPGITLPVRLKRFRDSFFLFITMDMPEGKRISQQNATVKKEKRGLDGIVRYCMDSQFWQLDGHIVVLF